MIVICIAHTTYTCIFAAQCTYIVQHVLRCSVHPRIAWCFVGMAAPISPKVFFTTVGERKLTATWLTLIHVKLEMWANAQPDGRPAKCRWRPLFNAAEFG